MAEGCDDSHEAGFRKHWTVVSSSICAVRYSVGLIVYGQRKTRATAVMSSDVTRNDKQA